MSSKGQRKARRRKLHAQAQAVFTNSDVRQLTNMREELARDLTLIRTKTQDIRDRLDMVLAELERRRETTPNGIHITDHAIVRFLQRYKGLDMNDVRLEIEAIALRAKKVSAGQAGRRMDETTGLTLGVDEINETVTTVFEEAELPGMEV